MDVLMLAPGYPGEMPHFTRGLAEVGAKVIGVGDQPADGYRTEMQIDEQSIAFRDACERQLGPLGHKSPDDFEWR